MKYYLMTLLAAAILLVTMSSYKNGGSSASNTWNIIGCSGSGCHGGTADYITVNFMLDSFVVPLSGGEYKPGKKYQITITATPLAAKYGFSTTVTDKSHNQAGILSYPTTQPDVKTVTKLGVTVAEHSNPINPVASGFRVSLDWTAPVKGTGDVSFITNVMVANNNGIADAMEHYKLKAVILREKKPATVNLIEENVFNIYPNPANHLLNIDIQNRTSNTYHYTIYAMNGVIAAQGHLDNNINCIDVSALASGMHFISITNGTQQKVITFNKL